MKVKVGLRKPSISKRIAARTSVKRLARHNLGLKAPRGFGWFTDPKRAAYNRVYNRTTKGCGSLFGVFLFAIFLLLSVSCAQTPKITTETILTAWQSAGLEAENVRPMTKDDYGAAPYVCSGMRFLIPSLGENSGGRLFLCDNKDDQELLAKFYNELGRQSAWLYSWVFVKGDFVVQINGDLDEATARQYETILNETVP